MFDKYFADWEVKPEFKKQYISLWPDWLGEENLHMLDEVTETQWSRFNAFILSVDAKYKIGVSDCHRKSVSFSEDLEASFDTFEESMKKDGSKFFKYVLPELDCVITEEWDYTYILWHRNNGALEAIIPFILASGLKHFG